MRSLTFFVFLVAIFVLPPASTPAFAQEDEQLKYYRRTLRPIMKQHCYSCHNEPDKKGGLNLERYDFIVGIIRDGPTWVKVVDQIRSGNMPPSTKPRIPDDDRETLIEGIEAILDSALSEPDPGQVVMRRLSNREYHYTVLDVIGVDFDARSFFPSDASGGEGFDNQAKVLYITPLLMERYLAAADTIVRRAYEAPGLWQQLAPTTFPSGSLERLRLHWVSLWEDETVWEKAAVRAAGDILFPLATRAYRRPLQKGDKDQLLSVFSQVFRQVEGPLRARFDTGLQESMKYMLVSPHFLYRRELEVPSPSPYPITNFELASRLSFFLWSSAPDDALLEAAYREDLHDPDVMMAQLERMLQDPKSIRLAESFAGQWLEIDDLLDEHEVDPDRFPAYSPSIRRAMVREAVQFFHHALTERQHLLDLLDSDYTFLNPSLASYYEMDVEVRGAGFQKVTLPDRRRGGVLGLGGVLTVTSLPTRTSPVLRGKWVLEQLLGTPPPPPPTDVPDLEEQASDSSARPVDELDIRRLLSLHREPSACFGCHQKMDPLGIGLENFDAVGRWRESYGTVPIDATGVLPDGEQFDGPDALRQVLLGKKELFARNLARKMLSFALGRGIRFQDKRTIDDLTNCLIDTDFASVPFLHAVVMSYPFRYKKSDLPLEETAP